MKIIKIHFHSYNENEAIYEYSNGIMRVIYTRKGNDSNTFKA